MDIPVNYIYRYVPVDGYKNASLLQRVTNLATNGPTVFDWKKCNYWPMAGLSQLNWWPIGWHMYLFYDALVFIAAAFNGCTDNSSNQFRSMSELSQQVYRNVFDEAVCKYTHCSRVNLF